MPDRLRLWLHRWPRALACALLPSSCALCGAAGVDVICRPCHQQYVAPRRTRCPCCANPVPQEGLRCGSCLANSPAYDATIAAVDYAAPLDQLVLQLKFAGRLALAPWFAHILRDAVLAQPGFALPDLLCPVPLGPRRLVERGFNQALEIARPLSGALGIALRPRLAVRARDTRAQSGVSPGERIDNIRGAFVVRDECVQGRHVGVVDDVMTSGQTLAELAAALKRAGAVRVSNLVFARTAPN
ncbi:ComF family protein [Massilia horti]|uniref:ComF family protein n=1 Tax=Massilia horti TaxID=2562153 RepID=A0A4Y9SQD0_9BURK|nr:ComF family protein [Massilia horti]TFW28791.1 ComF family protein [Massilia horti]